MKRLRGLWIGLCCLWLIGCDAVFPENAAPTPTAAPVPSVSAEPAEPVPAPGGTLRLAIRDPVTLNPLLNTDASVDRMLKLLFEPLVSLDASLACESNLASLSFSSDFASAVLTIRDDAVWSDGVPVTADDFLFSVETIREAPDDAVYKHMADNFAEMERQNDKNVKVSFVEPFGGSAYLFLFPVIPKHYYEEAMEPGDATHWAPLGNGAYEFTRFTPLEGAYLTRNPYTIHQQAYIEHIEALIVPDLPTELYAFDQGLIDMITMEITEWSRHHSVKETRVGESPSMRYEFIGFNFRTEILNNILFREALAYALDTDKLITDVYLSYADRALAPVHPASWAYNSRLPARPYDFAAAKEKLIESRRSVPSPVIPELRILVNQENAERMRVAQALWDALDALGLSARVEALPFSEYSERLAAFDYELFVGGYHLSYIPDLRFAFSSEGIAQGSNLFAYANPDLDGLMQSAASANTESGYRGDLHAIQNHIAEQLPVISLAFRKTAVLTDTRVKGPLTPSADNPFKNIHEWYLAD